MRISDWSSDVCSSDLDNEGSFALGPFGFRYVPLAHSIPEGNALLIETPFGNVFHTGDWKLDERPMLGEPSTPEHLTAIGDEGVLALVCDSTNAFNPEESGPEGEDRTSAVQGTSVSVRVDLGGRRISHNKTTPQPHHQNL